MKIQTKNLVIRDLQRDDEIQIRRISCQKNMVRFMGDWAKNAAVANRLEGYIDWHQTQTDSTDLYESKRYAVTLKGHDTMIGIVGMGLEDTLGEVEMAYFIDESFQGKGYATECLNALFDWCMQVSDVPYLILTIDIANMASCKVAEKAGFELFEKRTPVSHKQPNMESDSYYYFRKYRK